MSDCPNCAHLRAALHTVFELAGNPLDEQELSFALLPNSRRLQHCGTLVLILATDQYLTCILPTAHAGEHEVRIPVSETVLLRTIAVVAEQLAGAVQAGDRRAADLASELLSGLLLPDAGSEVFFPRRRRDDVS